MLDARLAAIAVFDGGAHLESLTETLKQSTLYKDEQCMLLVQAWEAAVEGALEDGLFTPDEENALTRYINHFNLSQSQLDAHGVHTSLIKAAVLREIAEGVVPDRQQLSGNVPFNLMKSENLVWVMDDVDYIETVVRRERRGSSHGLSIRIARGVYYRPSAFRSRAIEWEETVHQATGLLGFTTKHIYFSGPKKKFTVRYDRIVDFEPYDDGFGIMKDNQDRQAAGLSDRRRLVLLQPDPDVICSRSGFYSKGTMLHISHCKGWNPNRQAQDARHYHQTSNAPTTP